jgi:hypothetical protein
MPEADPAHNGLTLSAVLSFRKVGHDAEGR